MSKRDELWDAAITACYGDTSPILTQGERKRIGKLLNQLREINATPEDLLTRARNYPKVMPPGCMLTLAGIVNNWGKLGIPVKKKSGPSYHELYVSPDWQRSK